MLRVRIAGPRSRLDDALTVLQDLGVLHVDPLRVGGEEPADPTVPRARRHAQRCLLDVETALERAGLPADPHAVASPPPSAAAAARRARRVRRRAEVLAHRQEEMERERTLLLRYLEFFQVFEALAGRELAWPEGQAFCVVLRPDAARTLPELMRRLEEAVSGELEILSRELSTGEWAVLMLASARAAPKVAGLLAASRIEELPSPPGVVETDLLRALPSIKARLAAIRELLRALESERRAFIQSEGEWLAGLQRFLRDQLLRLDVRARLFVGDYVFIIEGWVPTPRFVELAQRIQPLGPDVLVSPIGAESWAADDAPVTLHNPPLFRPFEVLTRTLPLPRYGTIDPTPFVAIFFPAFFGLIVGDVGYGVMLALLAGLLWMKSDPASTRRSVATVAFACSSSAIAFGVIFGEFLGSLGGAIGLHPFFDREQATVPFLALAVAIGAVHIILGLVLAGVSAWRRGRRREAVGRGVLLGMLVLTAVSLLAALEVLPERLLTPTAFGILGAFVVLLVLEGVVAVIELLSTVGHILSYARIMALGTASLMLAIVANQMAGAFGSVLVGAVFALLFHLVNFAIGLFSPTIHALRLHYVEFFGRFFSPGGGEYRPFEHWRPIG
jgi:V/A-type H+-transporting ATPase subunit I